MPESERFQQMRAELADHVFTTHETDEYLVACVVCVPKADELVGSFRFTTRMQRGTWAVDHLRDFPTHSPGLRSRTIRVQHLGKQEDCTRCNPSCDCQGPTHVLGGRGCILAGLES